MNASTSFSRFTSFLRLRLGGGRRLQLARAAASCSSSRLIAESMSCIASAPIAGGEGVLAVLFLRLDELLLVEELVLLRAASGPAR